MAGASAAAYIIPALITAIGGVAAAKNQPGPANTAAGLPGGAGQVGGAFGLPLPAAAGGEGNPFEALAAQQGAGIDTSALTEVSKALAAQTQGPPPTVPLQAPAVGTPGSLEQGPPAPQASAAPPPQQPASIMEVLASSPEAIAAMANLLGFGPQPQTNDRAAPIPGGTTGRVVQGFTQPTPNIGALLAQLPRLI